MCISLFLVLLVPALQPAASPAQFPSAPSSPELPLPCTAPAPSHTQQRDLCAVANFFIYFFFFPEMEVYTHS